jgi:hypothetical protein
MATIFLRLIATRIIGGRVAAEVCNAIASGCWFSLGTLFILFRAGQDFFSAQKETVVRLPVKK